MDAFCKDFDPSLKTSIIEVIPESELTTVIHDYSGPDTKEGRLRALIPTLSSIADGQDKSSATDNKNKKHAIGLLGLIYSALDDWESAASSWKTLVDIDDQETLADHPERDLAAMFNLGIAQNHSKHYAESEKTFKRLMPMIAAVPKMGNASEQYLGSLSALMRAVGKQGRIDEARQLYSEHAAIIKQHPELGQLGYAETAKKILQEVEHDAREG